MNQFAMPSPLSTAVNALGSALQTGRIIEGRAPAAAVVTQLGLNSSFGPQHLLNGGAPSSDQLATIHAIGQAWVTSRGPNAVGPFAARAASLRYFDPRLPANPRDLVRDGAWGPRLFEGATSQVRSPRRLIQDALFDGMMADPLVKKRLISLLEILSDVPANKWSYYLHQYFPRESITIDGLLGFLLRRGTSTNMPERLVTWGMERALQDMGRRFLAGSNAHEAVATALDLHRDGIYMTLDVVTELVSSRHGRRHYLDRVLEVMRVWAAAYYGPTHTAGGVPVLHVSVKPSAMTDRFDPLAERKVVDDLSEGLYELACEAKRLGILLNVDSEHRQVRDVTYRAMGHVLRDSRLQGWGDIGFVCQATLEDAEATLLQILALADRLDIAPQIRVVKFAYHLYEQYVAARNGWKIPVYMSPGQTDASFLRLVRLLLLNTGRCRPAVGNHGIDDIAAVQEMRERLHLPIWAVEQEFLNGVVEPSLAETMVAEGTPTRFYGPFGDEREARGYEVRRTDEIDKNSAMGTVHTTGSWDEYLASREARRTQVAVPVSIPPDQFHNEPAPNFADRTTHQRMRRAIRSVGRHVARGRTKVRPMIGKRVAAGDPTAPLHSRNPATEELLAIVHPATADEVAEAVHIAATDGGLALAALGREGIVTRFRKAAEITRNMKYKLAAMIIVERGKTWPEALGDVNEAIDMLEYYARTTEENTEQVIAERRKPIGVGVAISPFNYFAIAFGETVGTMAEGSPAILKSAEQTSWTDSHVVRILRKAGFPPATVQFVPGRGETVGQALVEHPDTAGIVFTGSKPVADVIVHTAATHPQRDGRNKLVVAETGGKNPMIVLDDADVDLAVSAMLVGAFGMKGERCSAVTRGIIQRGIYERFSERFIEGARALVVGDPRDPITQVGPLIDKEALQKFLAYVEIAEQEGAQQLLGSKDFSVPARGFFAAPHIYLVTDRKNSRIWREEIFGPLVAMTVVDTFDEALAAANDDTAFGLTASLFTRDLVLAERFRREIQVGRGVVNGLQVAADVGVQPFGGGKGSGTGPKAGGPNYTIHYTETEETSAGTPTDATPLPWDSRFSDPLQAGAERLHAVQQRWAARPFEERLALARQLARLFPPAEPFSTAAARFLSPQTTVDVPGSINEEIFDWPLGIGLIRTAGETEQDVIAATIAAVIMGNVVVMEYSAWTKKLKGQLVAAGVSSGAIVLTSRPFNELLHDPEFDFLVAHGKLADMLANRFLANPARPNKFRRVIGLRERPHHAHYLTRYANSRTQQTVTFRNGTDLDWRPRRKG